MNYIISEEEFVDYLDDIKGIDDLGMDILKEIFNNLIKFYHKTPIKVIAEGKIAHNYYGFEIGNKNVVDQVYKWIKKCEGKKGKLIFIEDKEDK